MISSYFASEQLLSSDPEDLALEDGLIKEPVDVEQMLAEPAG